MGYLSNPQWSAQLLLNEATTHPLTKIITGISLALSHSIAEINWKIAKNPEIAESSSFDRVLGDLEAALAGAEKLLKTANAIAIEDELRAAAVRAQTPTPANAKRKRRRRRTHD